MNDRTPQRTAEAVRTHMFANDRAARMLGIVVTAIGPGTATTTMSVTDDMLNGHDICHGGLVTTLADTCFAYACNAYDEITVAAGFAVDLLAPGHVGDVLTAHRGRGRQGRTHRRLRHHRHEPARRTDRGLPWPVVHDEGQARAPFDRGGLTTCGCRPPTNSTRSSARAATRSWRCSCRACARRSHGRTRTSRTIAVPSTRPASIRATCRSCPTSPTSRSRRRRTCATTIRSGCSRCRARKSSASMRRPEPPASPRSSATRSSTSTPGPTWSRDRSARPAGGAATSCTSRTDTASSPAASARITARSDSAAR